MEMDAYLAAKLGSAAITNSKADNTALTSANILAKWDEYLAALADARISRDRVIAYIIPSVYKLLKEAAGITRFIDVGTGIRNVDRNVGKLDGVRIVEIPADLMKTAYVFTEGWVAAVHRPRSGSCAHRVRYCHDLCSHGSEQGQIFVL